MYIDKYVATCYCIVHPSLTHILHSSKSCKKLSSTHTCITNIIIIYANTHRTENKETVMEAEDDSNGSCNSTISPHDYTAYITIISSCLSMTGSALIILTFVIWRDIRTVARAIVVFLAIADFFTAAGYVFGATVSLLNERNYFDGNLYKYLCESQSFMTTMFPISSFLWTIHLAVYLYVAIVNAKPMVAKRLMVFFHVTGWGLPLLVCLPALLTSHLGGSGERTSVNWCFVYFNDTRPDSERDLELRLAEYYGFEFLCGKFWEISASIIAVFLYVSVKVVLRRRMVSEGVMVGE